MSGVSLDASGASIERVLTLRLVCERLRPVHRPEIVPLVNDPRVAAWIDPGGEPATEREVEEWLASKDQHWEEHGFGQWLLRDSATGEMVGRGGLQHAHLGGRDEVEIGWAIVPRRWGQGLATEMALAAIEVAFGALELDEVVAFTLPHNLASRRVMEKSGFAFERDIEHAGLPHVLYRRRRAVA
jgi:[ribosomal protein S5]-alanine N-acetyltransferase